MVENLEYDKLLEKFKQILKSSALKYTRQREAVLKVLYNNEGHFSPEQLYNIVKDSHPELNVGIATVYRTLNLLEESDIVSSISFGAQGKKYEIATKPHHDHMICRSCGKIIEFNDDTIERKQKTIAKKHDFKLTGHLMQLYGICSECIKKQQ